MLFLFSCQFGQPERKQISINAQQRPSIHKKSI